MSEPNDDGQERCPHCGLPSDPFQAILELMTSLQADGEERSQRLLASIEDEQQKKKRGF